MPRDSDRTPDGEAGLPGQPPAAHTPAPRTPAPHIPVSPIPGSHAPGSQTRAGRLEALRRQIARAGGGGRPPLPLDLPEIARALPPDGLPRAAVHEILGDDGAATGFAAWLAGRLARSDGNGGSGRPVVWICPPPRHGTGEPYLPGLAALGLPAERLILVRPRAMTEQLWAAEEALRSGEAAAVVIELPPPRLPRTGPERAGLDHTAGRRLQLAAEAGGHPGLLLRPGMSAPGMSAPGMSAPGMSAPGTNAPGMTIPFGGTIAVSRWQVCGLPGGRWRLDLLRCRGIAAERAPGWILEWTDDGADAGVDAGTVPGPAAEAGGPARRLAVAATLRHRPPEGPGPEP